MRAALRRKDVLPRSLSEVTWWASAAARLPVVPLVVPLLLRGVLPPRTLATAVSVAVSLAVTLAVMTGFVAGNQVKLAGVDAGVLAAGGGAAPRGSTTVSPPRAVAAAMCGHKRSRRQIAARLALEGASMEIRVMFTEATWFGS